MTSKLKREVESMVKQGFSDAYIEAVLYSKLSSSYSIQTIAKAVKKAKGDEKK